MIRRQNKFTDGERAKKKNQLDLSKKYLSADKDDACHKEISAF